MSDTATEAARLLAGALQTEPAEIDAKTAIGVTGRWDSLAHMRLVLALEEFLGKSLDTDEMLAIERFADVVAFIEKHGDA